MTIIFVHGRDQQGIDSEELKKEWVMGLEGGLSFTDDKLPLNTSIVLPYYGDMLADLVRKIDQTSKMKILTKGQSNIDKESEFRFEMLSELALDSSIDSSEISKMSASPVNKKGLINLEWFHAVLRALDHTPFGGIAIDRFTRDVFVYLTYYDGVRKIIDDYVRSFFKNDSEFIVVGHSLGSVVAYNVLRSLPQTIRVKAFITLGSPLGLKAVHNRLDAPIVRPNCVVRWFNAFDDRDVVALRALNKVPFDFHPSIINISDVDNPTSNKHGISGYLGDKRVALEILDALRN